MIEAVPPGVRPAAELRRRRREDRLLDQAGVLANHRKLWDAKLRS